MENAPSQRLYVIENKIEIIREAIFKKKITSILQM